MTTRDSELANADLNMLWIATERSLLIGVTNSEGLGFSCRRKKPPYFLPSKVPKLPLARCKKDVCTCRYYAIPRDNRIRSQSFNIYVTPAIVTLFTILAVVYLYDTGQTPFHLLLSILFGLLGAFIRFGENLLPHSDEGWTMLQYHIQYYIRLVAGGAMGVLGFLAVESKVVNFVVYNKIDPTLQTTWIGVAIASFIGGLLTKEIVGKLALEQSKGGTSVPTVPANQTPSQPSNPQS